VARRNDTSGIAGKPEVSGARRASKIALLALPGLIKINAEGGVISSLYGF
jgi:hypothetical protein